MKDQTKYSRRALLKGLGVGAGMLPLLSTEPAWGQTAPAVGPKRLIVVTWTNGVVSKDFYPPVGSITMLPAILQPLDAWKSQMQVLRSTNSATSPVNIQVMVDNGAQYDGHNAYPSLLTGSFKGATPSIDQIIGDALRAGGMASPQLNVGGYNRQQTTSYRGNGQRNTSNTNPRSLFDSLFAGRTATPGMINLSRLRRKSVIDHVRRDLNTFIGRLGTQDRLLAQAHLDSIRQLEMDVLAMPTMSTASCTPAAPTASGNTTPSNYPTHVKALFDVVALAAKCDVARVITMDLVDDGGGNAITFPWLDLASPDYHAIAHNGERDYPKKITIDAWYVTQVAGLVKQLAESPEGSGTVLSNSVVMITNDMGEGHFHNVNAVPVVLMGGCAGFFPKLGRVVGLPKTPNNHLLTTLCHAMGVNVASVGTGYAGNLDTALTT